MNRKRIFHTALFVFFDMLAAAVAWSLFFAYRKYAIEADKFGYQIPLELDRNFYLALIYIPIYWVVLYYFGGHYKDVWKRSRIKELSKLLTVCLIGVALLFFILLLDDEVKSYEAYYKTTLTLFILHFGFTSFSRVLTASWIKRLLRKKKIGFNTIIVGNNQRSLDLVNEILGSPNPQGYLLQGYVTVNGDEKNHVLEGIMPCLGSYEGLPELISRYGIEEVIIGIESSKHPDINKVTNVLEDEKVILKIIPDLYDVMSGSVQMNNIVGTPLIEINHDVMPQWQKVIKRLLDIFVSLFMLVLVSPLFLVLSIAVKLSSKGPVLYRQIRIGYKGKPFPILKFRTMHVNAELEGPALSSKNDKRITSLGRWLRKYRLDELPQFINVLKGDMSLVGPRPERKYFIDQIVKIAPHYRHLHRVKPGLTSWGQVKFGYAENVPQMIERLRYDIIYVENRSIAVDIRILIYTIMIILQGRGR